MHVYILGSGSGGSSAAAAAEQILGSFAVLAFIRAIDSIIHKMGFLLLILYNTLDYDIM